VPIIHIALSREEAEKGGLNIKNVTAEYRRDGCAPDWQLWTYQTHHGLRLENCEFKGYDDFDFYMVVWNPGTRSVVPAIACDTWAVRRYYSVEVVGHTKTRTRVQLTHKLSPYIVQRDTHPEIASAFPASSARKSYGRPSVGRRRASPSIPCP
jgi:hypothetical protein